MNKENFALVRKPLSAVEKAAPGAKRILSGMVVDTLALVRKARPHRIVIVDDDDGWLDLIVELVQEWFDDVETVTFKSAQGALRELEQRDPDMLITGVKMPRIDGEQLVRQLIAKKINYSILVLTGFSEAQKWVREYATQGFNIGFLAKHDIGHDGHNLKSSIEAILNINPAVIEKSVEIVPQPGNTHPLKIILVDDTGISKAYEPLVRNWFKENVKVLHFENTHEAWQELLREDPGLLITECRMPGLSGVEIVDRLLDRKAKYPIIMVSGWGTDDLLMWVQKRASQGLKVSYLNKPFTSEQLYAELNKHFKPAGDSKLQSPNP